MSSGIQACYRSSLTTGWFYFWQHRRESASYFFVLPTQKASKECSFPLVNIKKRKKKSPKIPWVWKLISRAASSLGRNYCPTANTAVKFHLAGMQTAAFSVTSQPNCPERSSGPVRTALRSAWHKPFPELPFSHHLLPPKMHFSKNHSKMYSSKGLARIREQWLGKVLAGKCQPRGEISLASSGNSVAVWRGKLPTSKAPKLTTPACTLPFLPSYLLFCFMDPFCELNQLGKLAEK